MLNEPVTYTGVPVNTHVVPKAVPDEFIAFKVNVLNKFLKVVDFF